MCQSWLQTLGPYIVDDPHTCFNWASMCPLAVSCRLDSVLLWCVLVTL